MAERVLVAMSGGVDSSMAAALLQEAGHPVEGVWMDLGLGASSASVVQVAEQLRIPLHRLNLAAEFTQVVQSFVDTYRAGMTPVPCTLCNRNLKFGRLLELADEVGAARLATGHYARLVREGDGRLELHRAASRAQDQTYFLWALSPASLGRARFPLGDVTKAEVRRRAQALGLAVADRAASQDLCFVPGGDHIEFLGRAGASAGPGPIIDLAGNVLGEHRGIETVTVGQRHGLGVAAGVPVYVVELRAASNTVVVGPREALAVAGLMATGASWPGGDPPAGELRATVRVRHRGSEHPATVRVREATAFEVRFDRPVQGVAPGQAAVLNVGNHVLGGGWISAPIRPGE